MLKKLRGLAVLSVLTMALTACQQFEDIANQEDSQNNDSQNEATQQLSEDYYQAVIEDNTYDVNNTRGLQAGPSSDANMKNMEKGLYELAQGVFPTDDFLFREGKVISEDQANAWLGVQSDDNPEGLNPSGYNSNNRDNFEPRYLNTILEYNLMQENEEGNLSLQGISIALAMNESDTFTNDDNEEKVEIDRETQIAKGKEMAQTIVSKIRENEDYQSIPIQVAIFINAAVDDIGGGSFATEAMVSEGSELNDWVDYNVDYVVYGVDSAPNEEDGEAVSQFQSEVEGLFPQLSGISGVGRYVDDNLDSLHITINSQFDGYTETLALTQKAIDAASNLFNKNLAIEIEIHSPSGTRAVLSRPSGSDTFNYTVL